MRTATTSAPHPLVTGLSKADYLVLKQQLMTRPHTLATLGVLLVMTTLLVMAWRLSTGGLPTYLLSQVMLAVVFFQAFALLHECGHSTASPHDWINVAVGHLASLLCFLPFHPWRLIHQQHHLWTGNLDRDPTLGAVRRWRTTKRVPPLLRAAWRSFIPLFAAVQHVVLWTYPLRLARAPEANRKHLVRCAFSVGFQVAVYGALVLFARSLVHPRRFALALLIYLVATELVNLPHHVGAPTTTGRLAPWEQWLSSRSCVYPRGLSELLVLNFNFHIEHHIFPFLPWYRLRAARHLVKQALGRDYHEEVGIAWNLRNRGRDLGDVITGPADPVTTSAPVLVRQDPAEDGRPGQRGRVVGVHEVGVAEVDRLVTDGVQADHLRGHVGAAEQRRAVDASHPEATGRAHVQRGHGDQAQVVVVG
jgi:fatty acid desaturase